MAQRIHREASPVTDRNILDGINTIYRMEHFNPQNIDDTQIGG
jgi:hypothetical protein